jgi:hypothetical protein
MRGSQQSVAITGFGGVGLGVWWAIWGLKGFWWGVLYGMFWPIWIGYRLAMWLWHQSNLGA